MKNFRPEDVPNLHPHLGERLARSSEEIRSRLEEARRMNIDELRQLQKYVVFGRGFSELSLLLRFAQQLLN